MNNLPENQDINEIDQSDEELSTVFSSPQEHKNKVKTKKPIITILCGLLVIMLLVGVIVGIMKFVPDREDTEISILNEMEILTESLDDYKTVEVKNINGEFLFYSQQEVSANDSETKVNKWYLKNYAKDIVNSVAIENTVGKAAVISGFREISEMSLEECGLVNPEITINVKKDKGEDFSILIGKDSLDNTGCYIKLSNRDKIYITDSTIKESFKFNLLDFASTEALPAFETEDGMQDYINDGGTLVSFDKLVIEGSKFNQAVTVQPSENEELKNYLPYVVTSPTYRVADNIDVIFQLFYEGLNTDGAYSLDVSNASLKKFGLDKPDFQATIYIKGKTYTFKFALQQDGNYAVITDKSKIINMISKDKVPFADYRISDLYSQWICLVSIDDIKSFKIEYGEKTYNFNVKKNDDESDEKYSVTFGGKKISSEEFQDFYQECVSLSCIDFTIEDTNKTPDYKLIFEYKDEIKRDKTVVELYKVRATRYQYKTNGVNLGKVTASSVTSIINSLEKLANQAK